MVSDTHVDGNKEQPLTNREIHLKNFPPYQFFKSVYKKVSAFLKLAFRFQTNELFLIVWNECKNIRRFTCAFAIISKCKTLVAAHL
jgi:hypothetical protein